MEKSLIIALESYYRLISEINANMIEKAISRLNYIVEKVPGVLLKIGDEEMSLKPFPDKWSKKEIIGHLIDSATNNHQRFVRAQFEMIPEIVYDQVKWNKYNFYQQIDLSQIVSFWTIYNKQIVEILKHIPQENLEKQVRVGEDILTIKYLILDYIEHLEHHLKQVADY
ncbi:DinB family protein [Flavobacterium coralii]|uniref:DinB family protein n=1 Tax=Flavobacterium coralii TaxID=2838017 RepID=UPI000C5F3459|nr:metal-dependent hydrolase [Flavobacterium sp.]